VAKVMIMKEKQRISGKSFAGGKSFVIMAGRLAAQPTTAAVHVMKFL
jgi:hypothetical protein